MGFRKNRSRHFGVFTGYSVIFHLAGLTILILSAGTQKSETPSHPITVRLVETKPAAQHHPFLSNPTDHGASKAIPSSGQPPSSQSITVSDLFHLVPLSPSSAQESKRYVTETRSPVSPLPQLTTNALKPVGLAHNISTIPRSLGKTSFPSRLLVDHKASNFLVSKTPAKILHNPDPPYPRIARKLGLEGKTLLRVEILQDGRPGTVKIRKSCGHTVLDKAAATAIREWKFAPAQDGLFAVRSVVDLPIRFSLKNLG